MEVGRRISKVRINRFPNLKCGRIKLEDHELAIQQLMVFNILLIFNAISSNFLEL
jgi:hypothetical protein